MPIPTQTPAQKAGIHYYIKRVGVDANYIDIESNNVFRGVMVSKVEGLEDKGKPKNIFTESYADAEFLRVHVPVFVQLESTQITMTLYFAMRSSGSTRTMRRNYDAFFNFVRGSELAFYDTKRYLEATMILTQAVSPEPFYIGDVQYLKGVFVFTNKTGYCPEHSDTPI